jgi:ribosomal protein S12 methylthiotransferase
VQKFYDIRKLPKVSFVSLGCPKNLVDSEVILGELVREGFYLCEDPKDSDILIINTCGFIKDAQDESLELLEEALSLKKEGKIKHVVAIGCLCQRYGEEFQEKVKGLDAVLGVSPRGRLPEICKSLLRGNGKKLSYPTSFRYPEALADKSRLRLTPRHLAYLRISEGCSRSCSFCVIPMIKGPLKSKPPQMIYQEAKELAEDGAREINIIAQDTTSYGIDLAGRPMLAMLIQEISKIKGIRWIRILYTYPSEITDDLIETIATNPKVVKYIDLPIQHTSNKILSFMKRGITKDQQKRIIHRLRGRIEGLFIRTSIIVGFPGEEEKDFSELLEDLEELRFERLGIFKYSNEQSTPSFSYPGQIPEEEKEKRAQKLANLQEKLLSRAAKTLLGKKVEVLVEEKIEEGFLGRTYADAPQIDCKIKIPSKGLKIGEIYLAEVTGIEDYDLIGRICEPTK